MFGWAWTLLGCVLLGLSIYEVYGTILRAHQHPGPLTSIINRGVWKVARLLTYRMGRENRHRVLSITGTLLLPLLGLVVTTGIVVAFAMIFAPHMPVEFKMSTQHQQPWRDAAYFSGVTLLTIGYGDITPVSAWMRVAAVIEGFAGTCVLSLATAYLLNIYGAVKTTRGVALQFYFQAGRGAGAAGLLTRHFRRGKFVGLEDTIRSGATDLQKLIETYAEHPVVYYFHSGSMSKSLPHMLFVLAEAAAVLPSCLDPEVYADVCDHPAVAMLTDSTLDVIEEVSTALRLSPSPGEQSELTDEHREACFVRTRLRLAQAGIRLRTDDASALREYLTKRAAWDNQLLRISQYLGYDWDETSDEPKLVQELKQGTQGAISR